MNDIVRTLTTRNAAAPTSPRSRPIRFLPAEFIVTGLVYEVRPGLIDTVVAPSKLRSAGA